MKRQIQLAVIAILGLVASHTDALARGFGGFHGPSGFHAGDEGRFSGGGFGGFSSNNFGGFRGDSFGDHYDRFQPDVNDRGGYHPEQFSSSGMGDRQYNFGGYRQGGIDASNDRPGGFTTEAARPGGMYSGGERVDGFGGGGGDRAAGGGGDVSRGQLNSFLGLFGDAGTHAGGGAAAGRWGAQGEAAQGPRGTTVAHGTAGAQGIAAGPGGVAAGGRAVSGTAVEGPRGNVYAHTTTASRGYADRNYSPTYMHAQGLAAQRWFGGRSLFTPDWCNTHPWAWRPGGYTAGAWATAAWAAASWPSVGTWFDWDAQPAYYDYGDNITYQNNSVYYGDQPIATDQQYYQQAAELSNASATEPPDDTQWLPLGVFALMPTGQKTPEMVFQLAVSKDGQIRGNYYEQIADTTLPVHGSVDKKNQRAAWHVGDNKTLVIETGLYNLTLNQSTALVHNGPTQTQQFVMIRVDKPQQKASND